MEKMRAVVRLATRPRSALPSARLLSTKGSPFAQPAPPSSSADSKLTKAEEQKQRVEAMAEMMREKTMREVAAVAASRRPEGVKHMLDIDKDEGALDAKIVEELGPQYAANYDEDSDEWGGPKGVCLARGPALRAKTCPPTDTSCCCAVAMCRSGTHAVRGLGAARTCMGFLILENARARDDANMRWPCVTSIAPRAVKCARVLDTHEIIESTRK